MNDLRRSFATWHLEAGVSNVLVAKFLGHTSTEMVDRIYGRPSDDALKTLTQNHFATLAPKAPPPAAPAPIANTKVVPITEARRRRGA